MPKEVLNKANTDARKGPAEVYCTLTDLVALQYEANGFSFLPKYAVQSVLSGRHRSRLRGRGLDFDEVRKYIPGDDIRNIDWKVTARVGVTHTKEFTEEKERPVLLVVDQSSSMFFGSKKYLKSVIAGHMAALAAWRVLDVGDRVGGIIFNDEQMEMIWPKRNRKTVQQLLSRVAHFNQSLKAVKPKNTEKNALNKALHQAAQSCGHDYLVTVMSDLREYDERSLRLMTQIKRSNDLIIGWVQDPAEAQLSKDSIVLTDGMYQTKLGKGKRLRTSYNAEYTRQKEKIKLDLKKYGIPCFDIDTETEAAVQLRELIHPSRG